MKEKEPHLNSKTGRVKEIGASLLADSLLSKIVMFIDLIIFVPQDNFVLEIHFWNYQSPH